MVDFVGLIPSPWDIVASSIFFVFAVVAFLVTLFTKRDVKKSIKVFKEILFMKNYIPKFKTIETRLTPSQSFSEEVKDYVLNEHTNELEESPVPKNIQDYINSHLDTALERALERFSVPNAIEADDYINDYTICVSDLSSLSEAMDVAEDYRERFNLPDSYSMSDIYSFVDKQAHELQAKLKGINKKEVSENVKKEEIKSEDK